MRLRTLQLVLILFAASMIGQDAFARGGGGGGRGGFSGGASRGGGFSGDRGGMNGGAGGYRGGANNSAIGRNGEFNAQHNTSNLFRNNSALNNAERNGFVDQGRNFGNYGGYGGYGGYAGWGGYGGFGLGVGLGYGLGGGVGYGVGGYGAGNGGGAYGYGNVASGPVNGTYDSAPVSSAQPVDNSSTQQGIDYAAQGEANFHAGRYTQAITDFRHAMIDDPNNGGILMVLGQALFETGDYRNAAGATEAAMGMLPEDKWGAAIENYAKLYGNAQDYTNELKSLEAARNKQPDDPALRFLLGFNFGYLGYPKQAVAELDKAVQLEGRDPAARKLHDLFAAKIDAPLVGPPKSEQPSAPSAGANHAARIPAAEIGLPTGD